MDWGSIAAGLGGAALGAFSGGGGQTQSSRGDSVSTSAGQTASNTTSTANTSGTSTQNSTNTTSGTSTSGPLSWQLPFLQQGMQTAQGLYQDASQMGAYEGDLYAGLNDAQRGTLDQVLGYVRGQGGTLNQGTIDAARTALQAGSGAADTLNQIAGSAGVGAVASDADVFANSGLGQRVQAAGGASSFDNVMDQARAYADEVTPGLVQAATTSAASPRDSSPRSIATPPPPATSTARAPPSRAASPAAAWRTGSPTPRPRSARTPSSAAPRRPPSRPPSRLASTATSSARAPTPPSRGATSSSAPPASSPTSWAAASRAPSTATR